MKTLVINLPQSTDRLRSLNEQLNAHPYLDVEVIEAVDGRRLSPEETDRAFDSRRFRRHYHRNPRPGEIGCTLSHQKAYRRIKETGVNTLILEDDIHILRDMRNELKEVDEWLSADRPRLLMLGGTCLYRGKHFTDTNAPLRTRIVSPYFYACGTYAYTLNSKAAERLITERPGCVSDEFISICRLNGIELKIMLPPSVTPTKQSLEFSYVKPKKEENRCFSERLFFWTRNNFRKIIVASKIFKKLDYVEY